MYTKAIRKVFTHNGFYGHIDHIIKLAEQAKFEALSHNGEVYIKTEDKKWVISPFSLSDFEVNLK